ncbi:MAG: helix-turn-helix transcriptional regulator [Bacteroidota bacterium]
MQQPELGLRITELRKQKGLTQEELVDLCNINVRTLQRIESGEVRPRGYTIKTILSALDYDYESLQAEQIGHQSPSHIHIAPKEAKSVYTLLTMAWIAGILFAITSVFEGVSDFIRIDDREFVFGIWGHVVIKILIVVFNGIVLYGFLIAGNLLKNHLMKISCILLFMVLLGFYVFDILSVFNEVLDITIIVVAQSICFGIVGILFGISILKSKDILGNTGLFLAIAELLLAFCLLTVILSPVALFLFFPVVVLEILVLYKLSDMAKEQLP